MKYVGGKARLARELLGVILKYRLEGQPWYEPFVGGANMIDKVEGERYGSDVNLCLISCLDALSKGWIPPESIDRDFYNECRDKYNTKSYTSDEEKVIGYVGINGSYGGRYYDGGFAGISITKSGKERNYPKEAYNNVVKQAPNIEGVTFRHGSYEEVDVPPQSLIYCDPPYKGTKEYVEARKCGYSTEEFWEWCRSMATLGHTVFVSEYSAPVDFECVWSKSVTSSLRANAVVSGSKKSVERLFVIGLCKE